ncbi:MAG: SRPBCC family protein [Deltaproteobacteria bacterium]|nr:SRPBCC family protein [Deltaproteobacteria bacterium]
MSSIARSIEVDVPVTRAFEAWRNFENLPEFLEGVSHVRRLDADHYELTGDLGGGQQTWEVRILEEIQDLLLSWESTARRPAMRTLTFSAEGDVTRISMVVEYEPELVAGRGEDPHAVMTRRIDGELYRFKAYIEARERRATSLPAQNLPGH